MENIKEIAEMLSEEERKLLEESREKPIVFDEDCPETTDERAIRFRRVRYPKWKWRTNNLFERIKKMFHTSGFFTRRSKMHRAEHGMITRTCRKCGKTITLPEDVQYWPDYCQECRVKYRPVQEIKNGL